MGYRLTPPLLHDAAVIKEPKPSNGTPAAVPSITSQTYDRLRAAILSGELAPGTKLKIDELL